MMKTIDAARVGAILEKSRDCRIAVFGDLMLDVYLWGAANRLSQEAPVPVLRVKERSARPGGAANVMRNLAALSACGISAYGVVGKDPAGEQLRALLSEGNLNPENVLTDETRRTTEKQRVLAGNQQIVRMDFEDTTPVNRACLERLAANLKQQIAQGQIQAVIFEDYAKGLMNKEILQDVVDTAVKYGVYTSLDPHPGHDMMLHSLSLMTPNRAEAFGLAGMYQFDADPVVERDVYLKQVAERILDSWHPESLLITLGAQGMALFEQNKRDQMLAIPTVAREVFDVSGAGDTVIAVYTLCMASGATAEEAAVIANHAAGIVVGKVGTATTTPEELLAGF